MKNNLQTKRLILRPWQLADADDLVAGLNNLKVSKWLAAVPYPYTKNAALHFIKFCSECEKKSAKTKSSSGKTSAYHFAIELKSENKVIGGTSIERIDYNNKIAGGGIWINYDYQGFGYGYEAFNAKIKFAFEKLKMRRLENGFFKGNSASLKMQKHLGYKLEGIRRKRYLCLADGKLKDEYITGLLKEDWEKISLLKTL